MQVKSNQPTLLRLITKLPWQNAASDPVYDHDHGREERRTARLIAIEGTGLGRGQLPWPNVATVIRIDRVRTDKNGTSRTTAYFITDRPATDGTRLLGLACRAHWSIENKLHWVRDVVFREDQSLRHIGNLPVIFSACFSIAIAAAARLGGSQTAARQRIKQDTRLLGALLGICLV